MPSLTRIADQRLGGAEQQHQHNPQKAHDRENRLVQNHCDGAVEPGRVPLHPGPESLLAGLVNIIPELTEPSEAQGLVGDPAGSVINHEDESAGQQQQAQKTEKTADHASPYISGPKMSAIGGAIPGNSASSAGYQLFRPPLRVPRAGLA